MEDSSLLQTSASPAEVLTLIQNNWKEFLQTLLTQINHSAGTFETPPPHQFNTLDAADTAELLQLRADVPGDLALVLYLRAARLSFAELFTDSHLLLPEVPAEDKSISKLAQRLLLEIQPVDLEFGQDAFLRPQSHPLFASVRRNLVALLQKCGMPEPAADAVGRRLPTAFFHALQADWFSQSAFYAPLQNRLSPENHFLARTQEEKRWNLYHASLLKDVDRRMLDECFGIREIYVPPLASLQVRRDDDASFSDDYGSSSHPQVIDLGKEILRWAYVPEAEDTVRLITGESGSGKTAFLTALAAKISGSRLFPDDFSTRPSLCVLSVSLADLPPQTTLRTALENYGQQMGLPEKFLDPQHAHSRLLLILDGLDQIHTTASRQEKTGQILEECDDLLNLWNSDEPRLQILGSTARVSSHNLPRRFQHPRALINLLPFYVTPDDRPTYHDEDGLMLEDKRHVWWKNFQQARGLKPDGLPEALATLEYEELTRLPLENYLTALAWIDSDEPLEKRSDANTIYRHLLNRGYSSFQRHTRQSALSFPQYERLLQELALQQWENQFARGVAPADLAQRMNRQALKTLLNQFTEVAGHDLLPVFSALFFRTDQARSTGTRSWRIHPRRFSEYLIARRLHQSALALVSLRNQDDAIPEDASWQERALQHWSRYTSVVPMTSRISQLLIREISAGKADIATQLHNTVTDLFNYTLRNGVPLANWQGLDNARDVVEQSRNCEEALLVLLNACALNTREVSQVRWPSTDSARSWLHRLQGAEGNAVPFALKCLDYLDLSGCQLMGCDLIGASLRHSDLSNAGFRGANLAEADMSYANLSEADLCVAGLAAATLYCADLSQADMRGAVLRAANLRRANLDGADLKGASLQSANASLATFGSADRDGVDLEDTDLTDSDIDPLHDFTENEVPS